MQYDPAHPCLAGPRSFCAFLRSRLDVAVRDVAFDAGSGRLDEAGQATGKTGDRFGRPQEFPAVTQSLCRPPRTTAKPPASRRRPGPWGKASATASAWQLPANGWRLATTVPICLCSAIMFTHCAVTVTSWKAWLRSGLVGRAPEAGQSLLDLRRQSHHD